MGFSGNTVWTITPGNYSSCHSISFVHEDDFNQCDMGYLGFSYTDGLVEGIEFRITWRWDVETQSIQ